MIDWTRPTGAMLEHVAAHMRWHDRMECLLVAGLMPLDALQAGVEHSDAVFCASVDGEPVCVFGGRNGSMLAPEIGGIWELGTDWIDRNPMRFARHSKRGLRMLWDGLGCNVAENLVWAKNDASRRWLYWLGASFARDVVLVSGEPFIRFSIER